MAKIGKIYLGGKDLDIPDAEQFRSGIAFPLKNEPEIDYRWRSQDSQWEVELNHDLANVVARSRNLQALDSLMTSGLEQIERCLDIVAVVKPITPILDHPETEHIAVFQRNNQSVLQHFSIFPLGITTQITVEIRDKDGNIKPISPIPEPIWTWAFRYYRLSQASHDIFDAYRNMFLSLEALLHSIYPQLPHEGEKAWLKRALSGPLTKDPLKRSVPITVTDPIDYFMRFQYDGIRCRLFHAKFPDALLPYEELNPTDVMNAYEGLLRLWRDIAQSHYHVGVGGGAFTYQGFKFVMDGLFKAPLSLYFTEDSSPVHNDDRQISPLGLATFKMEKSNYLGETKPGIVSWQGEIKTLDTHKDLLIHRVGTLIDETLFSVAFIKSGLSPSGVDIFQIYQNARLLNRSQPKTTF
jgi:hypothetical protein